MPKCPAGHANAAGAKFCSECGSAVAAESASVEQKLGERETTLKVRYVAPLDHAKVVHEKDVRLTAGKLPAADLRREWNIKQLVWVELEEPIEEDASGLSTVLFGNMKQIRVTEGKY